MDRVLSKAALAILAAIGLVVALGAALHVSDSAIDTSLTPDAYEALGIPTISDEWSASQRTKARSVLRELASVHPERLPRFESEVSGAVFQKLLDEELHRRGEIEGALGSLTGNQVKRMDDQEFADLIQGDSLEWIYSLNSTGDLIFDREIVQISSERLVNFVADGFELRSELRNLEAEPLPVRDFARSYRELIELHDASTLQLIVNITAFALADTFSAAAREDAAESLWQSVPAIAPSMSVERQNALRDMFNEAAASPAASPRLRELVDTW